MKATQPDSTVVNQFYPPRFKTLEGAQKALYKGDFSEQVFPFVVKTHEGLGEKVLENKEYEDAQFEIRYIIDRRSQ